MSKKPLGDQLLIIRLCRRFMLQFFLSACMYRLRSCESSASSRSAAWPMRASIASIRAAAPSPPTAPRGSAEVRIWITRGRRPVSQSWLFCVRPTLAAPPLGTRCWLNRTRRPSDRILSWCPRAPCVPRTQRPRLLTHSPSSHHGRPRRPQPPIRTRPCPLPSYHHSSHNSRRPCSGQLRPHLSTLYGPPRCSISRSWWRWRWRHSRPL